MVMSIFGNRSSAAVTNVIATPGYGPDRQVCFEPFKCAFVGRWNNIYFCFFFVQIEVQYADTKVIGNGSFGVVYQAKLVDSGELVAIKKVLQDKRFKVGMERYSCLIDFCCKLNDTCDLINSI